jgi:hypothetical protein
VLPQLGVNNLLERGSSIPRLSQLSFSYHFFFSKCISELKSNQAHPSPTPPFRKMFQLQADICTSPFEVRRHSSVPTFCEYVPFPFQANPPPCLSAAAEPRLAVQGGGPCQINPASLFFLRIEGTARAGQLPSVWRLIVIVPALPQVD